MSAAIRSLKELAAVESVPLARRDLPASTLGALQRGAERHSEKIALQFFLQGRDFTDAFFYTYEDVVHLVQQAANLFENVGIGPTDVVSVVLPNMPQTLFAMLGAQTAGIVNPIDPSLSPEQISAVMQAVGTKVVVTLSHFAGSDTWAKVASIADEVESLELILRVNPANYLGFFSRMGMRMASKPRLPKPRATVEDFGQATSKFTMKTLLSERQIEANEVALISAEIDDDTLSLTHHSHADLILAGWSWATAAGLTENKVTLAALPYHHVPAFLLGALVPWMQGASAVIAAPRGFNSRGVVDNFWFMVDFYKLNVVHVTPEVVSAVVANPPQDVDVDSLAHVVVEGGACSQDSAEALAAITPADCLQVYAPLGQPTAFALAKQANERGLIRLPYLSLRVANRTETGGWHDAEAGASGTVLVQRDGMWQDSGDRGVVEPSGRLRVADPRRSPALDVDEKWLISAENA